MYNALSPVQASAGRIEETFRNNPLYQLLNIVRMKLLRLTDGGYIADTPGFSSLETGGDYEFKERLISCFPDLYEYSGGCRFTSCTHTCEKGCGVIAAAENGEIQKSRLESYKALFEELKDMKPWQARR